MAKPILSQPRATRGKTVGRAVIRSFVHDIRHGADADFKPLYTQHRFNQMVEGLASEREYTIYLGYVAVYNGISEELVRSQAFSQQAQHGLLHLQVVLSEVRRAHKASGFFARREFADIAPSGDSDRNPSLEDVQSLFTGIEVFAGDEAQRAIVHSYHHQLLMPALRGLMAYNTLIGLLAAALDIPELDQLAAPLADIERDLDTYAADTLAAHQELGHPMLGELFPPARLADAAPDPRAVAAVRARLAGPDALQAGIVGELFIQLLEGAP